MSKHSFMVKALYDYEKTTDDEISLKADGIYEIIDSSQDWWVAKDINGNTGQIPSNFVEKLPEMAENVEKTTENVEKTTEKVENEDETTEKTTENVENEDETTQSSESINCNVCTEKISSEHVIVEGEPRHKKCFFCVDCKTDLLGKKFVIDDNKTLCEECIIKKKNPRCGLCNDPITGEYIKALNQNWHKEHFVCCDCGNPFKESFVNHENKPYCKGCFEKNFLKKCSLCDKVMKGDHILIGSLEIHKECFKCEADGELLELNQKINIKEKKIYCSEHYKKLFKTVCAKCNQTIHAEYFKVDDKFFHKTCWKCDECGEDLQFEDFKKNGEKYICSKHSLKLEEDFDKLVISKKDNITEETEEKKAVETRTEQKLKVTEGNVQGKSVLELEKETWPTIPYEKLVGTVDEVDRSVVFDKRENYLSDEEFKKIFEMDKKEFKKLTLWKQKWLKKEKRLF